MQESYSYYHIDSDKKAEIAEEDGFFNITPEEGIALINEHAAEYGVDRLSAKPHVFEEWAGQEDTYLNIVHEYSNEKGDIRVRFIGIEDNDGKIDTIEVCGMTEKGESDEFERQLCGYYGLVANLVNPSFDVEKFLKKTRHDTREQDGLLFSIVGYPGFDKNDIIYEYVIYTDKVDIVERLVYSENEY